VEACSHYLDEQIAMLHPEVILVLGRHALGRLLPGEGSITRLHGRRIVRGDRVYVPLYHPAAALYNASLLATLEEDMRHVREYLDERERRAAPEEIAARAPAATPERDQLDLFA
jgi:DNA polymerase